MASSARAAPSRTPLVRNYGKITPRCPVHPGLGSLGDASEDEDNMEHRIRMEGPGSVGTPPHDSRTVRSFRSSQRVPQMVFARTMTMMMTSGGTGKKSHIAAVTHVLPSFRRDRDDSRERRRTGDTERRDR